MLSADRIFHEQHNVWLRRNNRMTDGCIEFSNVPGGGIIRVMGALTAYDIYNNWNAQAVSFGISALINGFNFTTLVPPTAIAGFGSDINNPISTPDVIGLAVTITNTTDAATIVNGFRFSFRDV